MQAIVTKYFGPTDHRGSRIKAVCEAGSLTVAWDYALDVETNHHAAAVALATKLGWTTERYGDLVTGGMAGSGYCHVFGRERQLRAALPTVGIGKPGSRRESSLSALCETGLPNPR